MMNRRSFLTTAAKATALVTLAPSALLRASTPLTQPGVSKYAHYEQEYLTKSILQAVTPFLTVNPNPFPGLPLKTYQVALRDVLSYTENHQALLRNPTEFVYHDPEHDRDPNILDTIIHLATRHVERHVVHVLHKYQLDNGHPKGDISIPSYDPNPNVFFLTSREVLTSYEMRNRTMGSAAHLLDKSEIDPEEGRITRYILRDTNQSIYMAPDAPKDLCVPIHTNGVPKHLHLCLNNGSIIEGFKIHGGYMRNPTLVLKLRYALNWSNSLS